MSDKQGRNFLGVLYLDSESYDCQKVLSRIKDTFVDFAYAWASCIREVNQELGRKNMEV